MRLSVSYFVRALDFRARAVLTVDAAGIRSELGPHDDRWSSAGLKVAGTIIVWSEAVFANSAGGLQALVLRNFGLALGQLRFEFFVSVLGWALFSRAV